MSDDGQDRVDTHPRACRPIGIWVSAAANVLGTIAGAVFLFGPAGGRFRGMEPQGQVFAVLVLLAAAVGLFAGLPASLYDIFWQRRRLCGCVGALLSLTPWPVALFVSGLIAQQKGIFFD
jgi:hypothetical protein